MRAKRKDPVERRDQLLKIAVELAKDNHYLRVTREEVANVGGVGFSTVNRYFGTMTNLKRDIMRYAVKHEVIEVIAQGLMMKDPHAKKAPHGVKVKAASLMVE